jgi:hypothetical protein
MRNVLQLEILGRICVYCPICWHVGCYDVLKNKHATKHFHSTKHPITRSFEPKEMVLY